MAISETLRCYAPGGESHITEERVPPNILLQPLLHWVRGVAHFLASVCHKGRDTVQLEPPEVLTGLCSPEQWEGHLLEVIMADWRIFGESCRTAQGARARQGPR